MKPKKALKLFKKINKYIRKQNETHHTNIKFKIQYEKGHEETLCNKEKIKVKRASYLVYAPAFYSHAYNALIYGVNKRFYID